MKTYRIMVRLSLLSIIGLLVGAALVYFAYDFGRQERLTTKLQSARSYSSMMTAFRHFYTQEIVSRLKEQGSPIAFSHDFKQQDHALPLPATLTIELSNFLASQKDHPVFEMVSRHPFSNRPRKTLSPFNERALQQIELGKGSEYFEVTDLENGQTRLDYAQRIVMEAECISCHNNHPQSARRDWAVGDVRGLQTVAITSEREVTSVLQRMLPFLTVYILALVASVGLAYLFFARNRRAIEQLKDNASEIPEITPGMPVVSYIQTSSRTFAEMLFDPIFKSVRRSFRG